MIQDHLNVGFSCITSILFTCKTVAIKQIKKKKKKIIMKYFEIKFFAYSAQFENYNCNSTHSYN